MTDAAAVPSHDRIAVAVIGGSGFYELFDAVDVIDVETPYGPPSGPVSVGTVATASGPRNVAFLARHGAAHHVPPHRINYRANIWALHSLGVRRIIGPCASGSLRADIAPGDVVICDQFVDATSGREGTFFDGPDVRHASIADPYCPELNALLGAAARSEGFTVHADATVVVIPGPRFATRAESRTYRTLGYDLINMTQCPEVALAREMGMCYSMVALITDYDSGLDDRPDVGAVNQQDVFALYGANVHRLRAAIESTLVSSGASPSCACAHNTGI
jgi:5'-methylthioadenosine phosphorylase